MRDILGREIKDSDVVVAKGTGRRNKGLRMGVVVGNSVRFKSGTASYSDVFVIENPSEKDLAYVNEIKEQITKEKRKKEEAEGERKAKKAIHKKELVVGQQYKDDRGNIYLYLGQGKVTTYSIYLDYADGDWRKSEELEGYIYISKGCGQEAYSIDYYTLCRVEVRKTPRRLVEKTDVKLDIENPSFVVEEDVRNKYSSYAHKIEFELSGI